jgi:pyrroline-5-carboxylate reductase
MRILIIGGGNMGRTYAESFLTGHSIKKDDLYILEKGEEKVNLFRSWGYKNTFADAGAYIKDCKVLILAIKPQDCENVFEQIREFTHNEQIIVSVMAGIGMSQIAASMPEVKKIIRAMPNLPAQIGMGMTGFTSSDSVTKEELLWIHNLLNTTGKSLYFDDESKLDAVTAVSGSGPAFVFYFMNAVTEAAVEMGFSLSEAELLTQQTFLGAVHLKKKNDLSCLEWIQRVASKGGTTEAALQVFEEKSLNESIKAGLHKALARAVELGKMSEVEK